MADKIIKIIQNPTPNITISRNRDGKDFNVNIVTKGTRVIKGNKASKVSKVSKVFRVYKAK